MAEQVPAQDSTAGKKACAVLPVPARKVPSSCKGAREKWERAERGGTRKIRAVVGGNGWIRAGAGSAATELAISYPVKGLIRQCRTMQTCVVDFVGTVLDCPLQPLELTLGKGDECRLLHQGDLQQLKFPVG